MNIIDKIASEWKKDIRMYREGIIAREVFVTYYYDLRNTTQMLEKCNLISEEEKNETLGKLYLTFSNTIV